MLVLAIEYDKFNQLMETELVLLRHCFKQHRRRDQIRNKNNSIFKSSTSCDSWSLLPRNKRLQQGGNTGAFPLSFFGDFSSVVDLNYYTTISFSFRLTPSQVELLIFFFIRFVTSSYGRRLSWPSSLHIGLVRFHACSSER